MIPQPPKIPKKYKPLGFDILHEDPDLIVVNKGAGILTVAALWEKKNTVENALNTYVQKGNAKSKKCVFVVHRLDQYTSGVLIFAKTEQIQHFLKDNWPSTVKHYYAVVHGKLKEKTGLFESYLEEDDEYFVKSTQAEGKGKLARTEYQVVKETEHFSLLKINLLTGKKNQIRVHLSEAGHPIVGDIKYGKKETRFKDLMLHSFSITFIHPFKKEKVRFEAPVPEYFKRLMDYKY